MIVAPAFFSALDPPPELTVSQWADRFRHLSREASAEPGPWSTDRAPYQRAIMDALNDPLVESIVLMTSSQVGKTEDLLNVIGYVIDVDPSAMLLVQPTLTMAEAFSKDRLVPMLRDSPTLASKMRFAKRDASATILHKVFPGGHLTLAGSNSPASLASRPIRIVLGDEVDRWEVTQEGDPLALVRKRTTNFWNRKLLWVSTPTLKGHSRIEAQFEASDQRRCYVACPHCGFRHVLQWQHVKWEHDNPETAHLVCPECGCAIDEAGRSQMLRDPEWRATAPFHGIAGFHLWECYSPWRRLADIVADFLVAKRAPDTLQVFVNTSLGETWEERAEQTESHVLLARRELYPADAPSGACVLTMGVDVQDDRLEALVIGWGLGEESWVIASRVLEGDPQRAECWDQLTELLAETWTHESGAELSVSATCIDTGGHRTQFVLDYCERHELHSVYAVKGRGGEGLPILAERPQRIVGRKHRKVKLFIVGTDQCKGLLASRLRITTPGTGYVHLPLAHQDAGGALRYGVDEEFIAQLLAEKLVTKHTAGVPTRAWVPIRARNEALDMFVYAIAALRKLPKNAIEHAAQALRPKAPPPPAATVDPAARSRWIQPRQGGWLRGAR